MDSSYLMRCGGCYSNIAENAGFVLSCGDFLCGGCSEMNSTTCPLCNKQNINKLALNGSKELPGEVSIMLADTTISMENLFSAIDFQNKSYKRQIRKLIAERTYLLRKLANLESQHGSNSLQQERQHIQRYYPEQMQIRSSTRDTHTSNKSILNMPANDVSYLQERERGRQSHSQSQSRHHNNDQYRPPTSPHSVGGSSIGTAESHTSRFSHSSRTSTQATALPLPFSRQEHESKRHRPFEDIPTTLEKHTSEVQQNQPQSAGRVRSPHLPIPLSASKGVTLSQQDASHLIRPHIQHQNFGPAHVNGQNDLRQARGPGYIPESTQGGKAGLSIGSNRGYGSGNSSSNLAVGHAFTPPQVLPRT